MSATTTTTTTTTTAADDTTSSWKFYQTPKMIKEGHEPTANNHLAKPMDYKKEKEHFEADHDDDDNYSRTEFLSPAAWSFYYNIINCVSGWELLSKETKIRVGLTDWENFVEILDGDYDQLARDLMDDEEQEDMALSPIKFLSMGVLTFHNEELWGFDDLLKAANAFRDADSSESRQDLLQVVVEGQMELLREIIAKKWHTFDEDSYGNQFGLLWIDCKNFLKVLQNHTPDVDESTMLAIEAECKMDCTAPILPLEQKPLATVLESEEDNAAASAEPSKKRKKSDSSSSSTKKKKKNTNKA